MDMLSVEKNRIVDAKGKPVRLRGVCVGGWMNMENFINGYPGVEHGIRSALAEVLGKSKAAFFFDRWLDYFLAEEDIGFIKECGANVVRLALNYRHFERDAAPFEYVEAGFERLHRAVEWCTRHGLYVILDLHAVQGCQNTDWHCDNACESALFWAHPHFQERYIALWEELARRYKGNATVAGYDVMNEPLSRPLNRAPDWDAINGVYGRVVNAIRAIDPDHIIFLEGDVFGSRFDGFSEPFAENLVYSGHDYHPTTSGPGPYPGIIYGRAWDRKEQRASVLRHQGVRYTQEHNVPLWVGEFGAVYNGPSEEREDRRRALDDQICTFEEYGAHWTMWTYKDVGVMGWVAVRPESEYMERVERVLKAKLALGTDAWMTWLAPTRAQMQLRDLACQIEESLGELGVDPKWHEHFLGRAVLAGYTASAMEGAWARRFEGMTENELDAVLASFALKNCRPDVGLIEIVKRAIGNEPIRQSANEP